MKCWKCDRQPSESNPLVYLRLNDTMHSEYCCLPCMFDLGAQESQRRSQQELDLRCPDSTSDATSVDSSEK